jgi:hypothetical protein
MLPRSLNDWLASSPPPDSAYTQTLSGVAQRANAGDDFLRAVRELLDEVALMQNSRQRAAALANEPDPTADPRHDAYLGALGEHLAMRYELPPPAWTLDPSRFLERFWFVSSVAGFRAIAIAQSPAAFRRRGIFIAASSLQRV